MDKQETFFEKWSCILYTEAHAKLSGCLELTNGATDRCGYPVMKVTLPNGKRYQVSAARLMYMCHYKLLTLHGDVSHLCHNKVCVNIHHLVCETREINLNRQVCKNRGVCTKNHMPHCIFN